MFVLNDPGGSRVPIKVWLSGPDDLEPVCLTQARNLSAIPFVHQWVALMPDTHQGYGMPIGGVVALRDVVIPNAVGVDIGCGVIFMETDLDADRLDERTGRQLIERVMNRVPVGFKHQEKKQHSDVLADQLEETRERLSKNGTLYREMDAMPFQLGTLGGGNHFIELQRDENGKVCLMVHSGSRNFGKKIADYYNEKAKEYAKKHGWQSHARDQLAFLPVDSESGKGYLEWMNFALTFAQENRSHMMSALWDLLHDTFSGIRRVQVVNAHHNYAALEEHYGQSVWVHRKGAIRVQAGEIGIVPGAMGMESYLVEGLGNPESFCSCSHGAGRHISRRQAMKEINQTRVFDDLKARGVQVGTPNRAELVDESRFVYKDIHAVMDQQRDLVKPVKTMRSVLVIKG